jgi:hypothetical protein
MNSSRTLLSRDILISHSLSCWFISSLCHFFPSNGSIFFVCHCLENTSNTEKRHVLFLKNRNDSLWSCIVSFVVVWGKGWLMFWLMIKRSLNLSLLVYFSKTMQEVAERNVVLPQETRVHPWFFCCNDKDVLSNQFSFLFLLFCCSVVCILVFFVTKKRSCLLS